MAYILCRYEQGTNRANRKIIFQALKPNGFGEDCCWVKTNVLIPLSKNECLAKLDCSNPRASALSHGYATIILRDILLNEFQEFHVPRDNIQEKIPIQVYRNNQ